MWGSRRIRALLLVAVVGVLMGIGAAAVSGQTVRRLVYLDYNGVNEGAKPRTIFLTADSGPYLKKLKWTGWGTKKAVAHGTYVSACASCYPPPYRPAKVVFRNIVNCTSPRGDNRSYRIYRDAWLTTNADLPPHHLKTIRMSTSYVLCKEHRRR